MRPVLESEAGEGPGDNPTSVAAKGGKLQEPEAADMRKWEPPVT